MMFNKNHEIASLDAHSASSLHLFNDMLVCNTELVTRERQGVWNDLPTFFVNRIASEELLLLIQVQFTLLIPV